jgi:hypothetical protein
MDEITTPQQVERQLVALMNALEKATEDLADARLEAEEAREEYDNAMAKARILLAEDNVKRTVQRREDEAFLMCGDQRRMANAKAVRLSMVRDDIARIKMQLDATRSLGTSVRSSMDFA